MKAIVLYLHVHQPYRVRHYTIFDAGQNHDYFGGDYNEPTSNQRIIDKVSEKSYIPTNRQLLELLQAHPEFRLSLSITGTLLEQLKSWAPEVLASFQELTATGRVEIVAETYHHSLAFFYSRSEFETQVAMHRQLVEELFGQTPKVFRNTELAYNNELAMWAESKGYKAILAEGWDRYLGWRSPNFVYRPSTAPNIKLLLKNYKLSDDIAFRFGDQSWVEWPLTADKFAHWLNSSGDATNFGLFMDYETFGEHQWGETGIFNFLKHLPEVWLKQPGNTFMTVSETADMEAVDDLDIHDTVTWADTERDLSAWLGNGMQQDAIRAVYDLESKIIGSGDDGLIADWRRLQTSDHFYYMCTKWFKDGDIHAYFSPYASPYIAYIAFMNAWHDVQYRLSEKGIDV
jgi:alpha-amylase